LQNQIRNISLTPGPQGIPGIDGASGLQGPQGPEGVCSCDASSGDVGLLEARITFLEQKIEELTGEPIIPPSTTCSVGYGACQRTGNYISGYSGACDATPGTPSTEVCDNIDNDCDGQTDENGGAICGGGYQCNNGVCNQAGICGDGVIGIYEQCDDGNMILNDGCDRVCMIEPGWICTSSSPSVCTQITCDDGNACTIDSYNAILNNCAHTSVACSAGETCNPVNGQCVVVCNTPPPTGCISETVAVEYNPMGTYSGSECVYTSTTTNCAFYDECSQGVCQSGIGCNSVPINQYGVCMNGDGECIDGYCSLY